MTSTQIERMNEVHIEGGYADQTRGASRESSILSSAPPSPSEFGRERPVQHKDPLPSYRGPLRRNARRKSTVGIQLGDLEELESDTSPFPAGVESLPEEITGESHAKDIPRLPSHNKVRSRTEDGCSGKAPKGSNLSKTRGSSTAPTQRVGEPKRKINVSQDSAPPTRSLLIRTRRLQEVYDPSSSVASSSKRPRLTSSVLRPCDAKGKGKAANPESVERSQPKEITPNSDISSEGETNVHDYLHHRPIKRVINRKQIRESKPPKKSLRQQSAYTPVKVRADVLNLLRLEHTDIQAVATLLPATSTQPATKAPTVDSKFKSHPAPHKPPKSCGSLKRKKHVSTPIKVFTPIKPRNKVGEASPLPEPSQGPFIPSSKFARVLRLVAQLGPPQTRITGKTSAPMSRPPVWAESRQELCEALPYYRAFQAGLYMLNRVAYGYLLEAFPAPRDIWALNGRIVISHGGGQCVRTTDKYGKKGEPALAGDQSESDARVDTLLQAHHRRTPLILIAGEGYEGLSWKLGCTYAVLGWYWISAVWVEAEPVSQGITPPPDRDYFHRYKIRFDWVQSQGIPWWEISPPPSAPLVGPAPPVGPGGRIILQDDVMPFVQATDIPYQSRSSPPFPLSSRKGYPEVQKEVPALATGLLTPPTTPPEKSTASFDRPLLTRYSLCDNLNISIFLRTNTTMDYSRGHLDDVSEYDTDSAVTDSDGELDASRSLSRKLPGEMLLVTPFTTATSGEETAPFTAISRTCPTCSKDSPRMYKEGWICLNQICPQFWFLDTIVGLMPVPPGFSLSYDYSWLSSPRTPKELTSLPYNIRPPAPTSGLSEVEECAGDRTLWKGWVCDGCGRANCRYRWEVWECRGCGKRMSPLVPEKIISAFELQDPQRMSILGDAVIDPTSRIKISTRQLDSPQGVLVSYTLPRDGTIHHLIPSNKLPTDKIWEMYQREAAGTTLPLFERKALNGGTVKGQLLAQHFAVNSGARYKYNVETASLTFDESPECVLSARQIINNAVKSALVSGPAVNFNEVLSVMYREGQKMSWHDDGEEGLGPIVASLSLGSCATMQWRPKIDRIGPNVGYYGGKGVKDANKKRNSMPETALSVTLSHGDIIIMEGEKIQMRYSHRVVPHGFRVAATARVIG